MPHNTPLPPLIITFESDRRLVAPGETCTFGRAADIDIDSANRLLHRVLGRFFDRDGQWWLSNDGRSVAIVMTDLNSASYTHIVAGASTPLPFQLASLSFTAGRANYRMQVRNDAIDATSPTGEIAKLPVAEATLTTGALIFNEEQFELLVALSTRRVDGPIASADLPSNRKLAQQLGWSPSKLTRKLDNLCTKLTRAGVPGLQGSVADAAVDRRVQLANFVVEQGIVTRLDLPEAHS